MKVKDFYELADLFTRSRIEVVRRGNEELEWVLDGEKHTYYDCDSNEWVDEWPDEILNMKILEIKYISDYDRIYLYVRGENENENEG